MEIAVEMLEAGFLRRRARRRALKAGLDIQIQHQRQIGLEIVQHHRIDAADGFARHAPARALIGIGGIGEAVADHPFVRQQAPGR